MFDQLRDTNFAIVGSLLGQGGPPPADRPRQPPPVAHHGRAEGLRPEAAGYQAEQASLKVHVALAEEIKQYTQTDQFGSLLEVQQNLAAGADPSTQSAAIEELIAQDAPPARRPAPALHLLVHLRRHQDQGVRPLPPPDPAGLRLPAPAHLPEPRAPAAVPVALLAAGLRHPQAASAASAPAAAGTKTNYTYLRKQLRLIVDDVNERDPNDIAYVYSLYAPLSVRLVQCILQKQHLLTITKGNGVTGGHPAGLARLRRRREARPRPDL